MDCGEDGGKDWRRVAVVLALAALVASAGCLSTGTGVPDAGDDPTTGDASATPLPPDLGQNATVTRVVDGDTIEVELADGTVEKVRLIGVDTPEIYSENTPAEYGVPDTQAGRDCLRRYGERATEFATDRLTGKQVRIVPDPNLDERGYYGRLLAYVYVDGVSFNRDLVERGYARVFESDFTERADYEAAAAAAREADRNLWECATDTDAGTTQATVSASGIVLATVNADADGPDGENLNDEYVVLENVGDDPVSLSGWTIRDEANHSHTFEDLTLDPGDRVTLHTGTGTDTETDRYWGSSTPIWNNGGDTVTLVDDSGTVVLTESY